MRYLIFILSLIYIIPVKAQVAWIGTAFDRKHQFIEPELNSAVFIYVLPEDGYTFETAASTLEGKIILSSTYTIAGRGTFKPSYEIELSYENYSDPYLVYKAVIPAHTVKPGRYRMDGILLNKNTSRNYYLKDYHNVDFTITAGQTGVVSATLNYEVKAAEIDKQYGLVNPENSIEVLPVLLEGIYTHGFCKDEQVSLSQFRVHLWKHRDLSEGKVFFTIQTDGNEYILKKELQLIRIPDAGELPSPYFPHTFAILDPESIEDRLYGADLVVEDLLALVGHASGIHTLHINIEAEFFDNHSTLIENDVVTNFEIASAPVGADCQAILLPIELVEFEVFNQKEQIFGYWIVATEINCAYYLVEKSQDASTWTEVHRETSRGSGGTLKRYDFLDKTPWPGVSYYRIRQVDLDGSLSYSKVAAVHIKSTKLRFYPNPVKDVFYYMLEDPDQQYQIKVFNQLGSCVFTATIPDPDYTVRTIDLQHLPPGIYYINYIHTVNFLSQTEKFLKQ